MIQFGHDESHLETVVEKKGIIFQIDMHLKKNSPKGIAIDKVPIRRASELFGIVHFVSFLRRILILSKRVRQEEEDLLILSFPSLIRSI